MYLDHKQKELADSILKNRLYKAYKASLDDSVPTFVLREQLTPSRSQSKKGNEFAVCQ